MLEYKYAICFAGQDAARKLAASLQKWKNQPDTLILALPRGGVPMGETIGEELNLPMDIVVPRKIGHPMHEEVSLVSFVHHHVIDVLQYGVGAITETGDAYFDEENLRWAGLSENDPVLQR